MDKKRRQKRHSKSRWQYLRNVIMEGEDESSRKPKFSTTTSKWITDKVLSNGDLSLNHGFLGIKFRVPRESLGDVNPSTIKFRINNKPLYEPSLEGNDHRVYDVIQVFPKEFAFSPPAEMTLRLPSCVHKKSAGQVICMFGNSYGMKNDTRYLKWGRLSSNLLIVNNQRTEAKVICLFAGFYTIVLTQCPEVTAKICPERGSAFNLQEISGIRLSYGENTVETDTKITVKVVRLEDLYNSPSASPMSLNHRRRFPIEYRNETNDEMMDVTGSPVILIRPIRTRFCKPVKLSLPLLGDAFEGFFDKETSRLVVLRSRELDDDAIVWYHHYSTPEVEITSDNKKVATFLVTSGGLYKVVRRFPKKHMRVIEQVSSRISRELCHDTSPDVKVTLVLKGLITEIAEPGKQFVLRICLLDPSQPKNPDSCFRYEVCSQPLTVPLGKVRFLVRGRFEPDRDAADHTEERILMFTGKTAVVDFHLKLRLSDPTKLPEHIGKVTVHSTSDLQYFVNLHKPVPIPKEDLDIENAPKMRKRRILNEKRPLRRSNTVSTFRDPKTSIKETTLAENEEEEVELSKNIYTRKGYTRKSSLTSFSDVALAITHDMSWKTTQPSNNSKRSNSDIETQIGIETMQIDENRSASALSKSSASHSSLRSDDAVNEQSQEDEDDWSEHTGDVYGDANKEFEERGDDWSEDSDDTGDVQDASSSQQEYENDWSEASDVTQERHATPKDDKNNNIMEENDDWPKNDDVTVNGPIVKDYPILNEDGKENLDSEEVRNFEENSSRGISESEDSISSASLSFGENDSRNHESSSEYNQKEYNNTRKARVHLVAQTNGNFLL